MPSVRPGEIPLYHGALDCAKKTVARDGVLGFYKGMGAPVVGVAPIFAICFFGYNWGKKVFAEDPMHLRKHEILLAGMFSGVFTTAIVAPGERIKCLLQIQSGSCAPHKYKGPIDVVRQLYREGGLRSLFRGTVATLLRDIPASGAYFLSYEWIKDVLKKRSGAPDELGVGRTLFAGGMAGIFNWLVGIPPDVLKSRYQSAPEGQYPNGIRSVFSELIAKEGIFALYRGATPVLLRAFPANAACFLGFEVALKFLDIVLPGW
ncbi:Carnitine/acylcarnitine translocase [Fasciola hepatica]|uniref:Carnitine/acylcarnitine translocase n=1 Tax=Fasciola hepatica TaxID=6192 RepID=A0A4E0QZB4_FASHE|nr:Carnitine/acylcarnitine translocase [Fasciola hepatica]